MRRKKVLRIFLWVAGGLATLVLILFLYLLAVATISPPEPSNLTSLNLRKNEIDTGLFVIGKNWFRKSESGLYELYVEGKPFERGVINGKLTEDQVRYQEVVFNKQIHRLVPNNAYLNFHGRIGS